MSLLTKLFVVLHVVLSMLLVAGLVVFVNRVDTFSANVTTLNQQVKTAQERAQRLEVEAMAANNAAAQLSLALQSERQAAQTQLNTVRAEVKDTEGELAKANQDLAEARGVSASVSEALQLSQASQQELTKQIASLRDVADKTQQRNTELELALSDRANRLQVAMRQIEELSDEVQYLKEQQATVRGAQARVPSGEQGGGTQGAQQAAAPAQQIIGEVRATRNIGGVPYATISVGASDNVQRGTTFYVIDRRGGGGFLGTLTVVNVEPNEATGRLSGPRVAQVGQGAEVRTQLN